VAELLLLTYIRAESYRGMHPIDIDNGRRERWTS